MVKLKALNPKRQIFNAIGSVASDPKILKRADVDLDKTDVVDKVPKIILSAIINLAESGKSAQPITVLDVDNYVAQFPKTYEVYQENKGFQYLDDSIKNANESLFEANYVSIKKYSYLRKYFDNGIDITEIIDYNATDIDKQQEDAQRIHEMSVDDIIDHFSTKTQTLKKQWQATTNEMHSFKADDDIENLVERLNVQPNVGYPFQNGYYNQLFGGMQKSKYLVRSTITGGGKTRQALRDFCNVAFSCYYNWKEDRWIKTGKPTPALFISTELNQDEIQTIILSYITGINSKTINFGQFNKKELKLLTEAVAVAKDSNYWFEYIEDFDTEDIKEKVDEYVKAGVEYVNFDYIQPTPKLMKQFKGAYGSNLREDQALVYLSKELKGLAEKYNIFMMSSTQVNAAYSDDDKNRSRTEYALRGGKSIADKIDYGVITSRFTKADRRSFEKVDGLQGLEPNYAHHVYKNRNGEKDVIVWTWFNPGTLREKPLIVTDYNYNVIDDMKEMEINYDVEEG